MTDQRFLPFEIWHPMLLEIFYRMIVSDPERFNIYRIRDEKPELFEKIRAKSDEMVRLIHPTENEVRTYAAEYVALFPEVDEQN